MATMLDRSVTLGVGEPRRATPIRWWAGIGVVVLALQVAIYAAWLASGPTRTPDGHTPLPDWIRYSVRGWEALSVSLGIVAIYWFIIRPWRRERRLTLDGMLCIAFLSMYWQDPLVGYSGYWAVYGTPSVQFGSWLGVIPGHLGQNASQYVEPLVFALPGYVWFCLIVTIGNNALMRRVARRSPNVGRFGLFMAAFASSFVMALLAEGLWVRMGLYHFAGGIRWLTLFHGQYYQVALNEIFFFSIACAGWAILRWSKDDHGLCFAERGAERLVRNGGQHTGMRLLAIIGAANAIYFVGYMLPQQWFGLHTDSWPQEIQKRSYMTGGLCGPGTNYACPGPGTPNPRPDATYITPNGDLYHPKANEGK